ncbi:MAG: AAA family ATPase [Chloroflexi bacterium]|nr:AAA family ATPase [Chloroflexota bacterium]
MTKLTEIFGGPVVLSSKQVDPPELQLANAMRSAGIDPPLKLEIDGQLHRFSTKGRKRDDSGWYVIFPDEPVAGRFGCWRDQIDCVFRADIGRDLSAAENMAIVRRQSEARDERERERAKKADVAASTVETIWRDAIAASPDQPYLKKKGIQPHGARLTGDGRLIVPLFAEGGTLSSLQYISETEKRYHPGGSTKGCSWKLGEVTPGPIFVAEGYATAATIHEVSGRPCVVAYSANNLPLIVGQLREAHGQTQEIVIVADNDESRVGRNKADEASAKYGGRIVMPPTDGDANDYQKAGEDLLGLLFPPVDDWLVPADSFSEQPAPLRWQIKHWLQSQALIMVHGPSGCGKTFLVLDMVLSVASKGAVPDWFGNKVRHGTVVYLAGEGHHGLRGRVAAWKQHKGVSGLDMWLSRHGLDLNTPQGYQKTVDAIRALPNPPEIIVVDTLHRFLDGDENSAADAKSMLDACGAMIHEFDCSVILVHHTGVSVEAQHRARGSSAWRGALDIEISVIPGETIEINQRKSKDAEEAESVFVELQSVPIKGWLDEDGDQVSSAVLAEGIEPVKAKKDSPIQNQMKVFENGWWDSGAEDIDGDPYLTKAAFGTYFEKQGYEPGTVKNYLKPSFKTGPIAVLIQGGIISAHQSGWIVLDKVWSSGMMMSRGQR